MKLMLFAGCAAFALAAGDTAARDADGAVAVEEVVVTAQKRTENLQDVPVSVTALSGQSLTDRGVTNAGLSLLDADYGSYSSEGSDFSGNRLPQSPEVTFNVVAKYSHPLPIDGEAFGAVDAAYSSKVYFDNSNAERLSQDGAWVVGAQAGWRSSDGKVEAGVFARNLFDETHVVAISNIDSLGEDLVTLNRPRSLGAFLRYRY